MTEAELRALFERSVAGESTADLAQAIGISRHALLARWRYRGWFLKGSRSQASPLEDLTVLRQAFDEAVAGHAPVRTLAKRYGAPTGELRRRWREQGWSLSASIRTVKGMPSRAKLGELFERATAGGEDVGELATSHGLTQPQLTRLWRYHGFSVQAAQTATIPEPLLQALFARAVAGESVPDMAAEHGITVAQLRGRWRSRGMSIRTERKGRPSPTARQVRAAHMRVMAGADREHTAQSLGLTWKGLYSRFQALGLKAPRQLNAKQRRLYPIYRRALQLRADGLTWTEVAQQVGWPPHDYGSLASRAATWGKRNGLR